jgi:hypothetical protein
LTLKNKEFLSASGCFVKEDNVFRKLFKRLAEELRKPFKMAMVAVIHKMVRVVHALIKKGEMWNSQTTA